MDAKEKHFPEISVIVPVYNAEKTVGRCLDSLLAQRFPDFELILVDDGSTDSSLQICRSYAGKDGRVRIISKANGGVSSARNAGIDAASGRYVAFCDSDDRVGKDWLCCMYEAAASADMVVCGYNIYGKDKSPVPVKETLGTMRMFSGADEILETLMKARLLQFVWNKLFRRETVERAGLRFDESFEVFEDEYFVLGYLTEITDVACVPQCEYDYFLPADFYSKYDFGIDAFQKVVDLIYRIVASVPGRIRLPSVIYWYKVALGRYASSHSFEMTKDRILFARSLASSFHDGFFNHLLIRVLPSRMIYRMLRKRYGQQRH